MSLSIAPSCISNSDMERARKALALAMGYCLADAASLLDVTPREMDLLLWNRGGGLTLGRQPRKIVMVPYTLHPVVWRP